MYPLCPAVSGRHLTYQCFACLSPHFPTRQSTVDHPFCRSTIFPYNSKDMDKVTKNKVNKDRLECFSGPIRRKGEHQLNVPKLNHISS